MPLTTRQSRMLGTSDGAVATVAPAVLGVKSVRTQQPQQAVGIDWSNPITRGLVVSFSTPSGLLDSVSNKSASIDSGFSYGANRLGQAYRFNGVTDGITFSRSHSGAYSIFALAHPDGTSGTRNICSIGDGTSYAAQLRQDGSQWSFYHHSSTDKLASEASGVTAGSVSAIVATWDGVSTIRLYRDGLQRGINATANSLRTVSRFNIGQDNFGAKQAWLGGINIVVFWNRALSDAEIRSISAKPWQIFLPLNRQIWVAA